jgi:hypothetical protein
MKVSINHKQVAQLLDDALDEIDKEFAQRVLQAVKALKEATPKDTGRASKGWSSTLTKAQVATIVNEVPYIGILNDGHSQQAPSYFVETTLHRLGFTIV